jgi:hypothetical protein
MSDFHVQVQSNQVTSMIYYTISFFQFE